MKYFILEADKTVRKKPTIKLSKKDLEDNNPIVIIEKEIESHIETDYIENEYPIFSERLKELISSYDKKLMWKAVVIIMGKIQTTYWLLRLLPKDCLSEKTEINKDLSIKKPILDKGKINIEKILSIKTNTKQKIYIVNLDLAESILRREFIGVEFKEIEISSIAN